MEKNILSIAGAENKENNSGLGYGKVKIINDCPYYSGENEKNIGDCSINHFKLCTLEPNKVYFDCNTYKLSFL